MASFSDKFNSNLTSILGGVGDDAIYQSSFAMPQSIKVVAESKTNNSSNFSTGYSSNSNKVIVQKSAVPDPEKGDSITIDAIKYEITHIEIGNTELEWKISLKKK